MTKGAQTTRHEKLSPLLDVVFRRLFDGEEGLALLCSLLNAILKWPPEQRIVKLEPVARHVLSDNAVDKEVEFDLYAVDLQKRRYEIEVQLTKQDFYPNRILFYWSKMYAMQLDRQNNYHNLHPCIGVHLIRWAMFGGDQRHHLFELTERTQGRRLTDHLQLHILELPKYPAALGSDPTDEERWLYFMTHARDLDRASVEQLGAPIMQANERLELISQDEGMRILALSREKRERDRITELADAEAKGHAEGHAEGMLKASKETLAMLLRGCAPEHEHVWMPWLNLEENPARIQTITAALFDLIRKPHTWNDILNAIQEG